mgnify:CR=1 FL=1
MSQDKRTGPAPISGRSNKENTEIGSSPETAAKAGLGRTESRNNPPKEKGRLGGTGRPFSGERRYEYYSILFKYIIHANIREMA